MSCDNDLQDIEDMIVGDISEAPRKSYKDHAVKKALKKKKDNIIKEEKEYEPNLIQNVPGTQKIFVKTFGCSHNISDSEFMMGQLADYGYEITENAQEADLVLVNSCTVKNPSQDAFVNLVEKNKGDRKPIVVAGCVPQGDKNIPQIEDVSVIGVTQIDRIVEVVEETLKGNRVRLIGKKELPSLDLPKIRKNKFIEIVPINTGCLGSCTYCKTRHARGKLGSYQPEAIVKRVKDVAEEGVKEIWITSEDTGAYGRDIGTNIAELLKNVVNSLPADVMLRVGMTNPPYILEHLEAIAKVLNHPRVYAFLHIPVQAGNNTVLDKMNREYTVEEFETVCDYLIKHVPDITIATDIICGFPEETAEEFEDTLKLVRKYKFPILNISQFYSRPGTVAAKMQKVQSKDVKARSTAVTQLFESYTCYDHLNGTEQLIWIRDKEFNKKNGTMLVGHTKGYVKVLLPFEEELLGYILFLLRNFSK